MSRPKWGLEHIAEHQAMAHVEVAAAALLGKVAGVLHKAVRGAAEELLGSVVNRMRVGICGVEAHASAIPLFGGNLETVVARISHVCAELNGSESRIGNDWICP